MGGPEEEAERTSSCLSLVSRPVWAHVDPYVRLKAHRMDQFRAGYSRYRMPLEAPMLQPIWKDSTPLRIRQSEILLETALEGSLIMAHGELTIRALNNFVKRT